MFILYSLVYLKLRGIARAETRSKFFVSANHESNEKYEHRLARQMLWFPVSFFRSYEAFKPSNTSLVDFIHHHDLSYWSQPRHCVVRPRSFLFFCHFQVRSVAFPRRPWLILRVQLFRIPSDWLAFGCFGTMYESANCRTFRPRPCDSVRLHTPHSAPMFYVPKVFDLQPKGLDRLYRRGRWGL